MDFSKMDGFNLPNLGNLTNGFSKVLALSEHTGNDDEDLSDVSDEEQHSVVTKGPKKAAKSSSPNTGGLDFSKKDGVKVTQTQSFTSSFSQSCSLSQKTGTDNDDNDDADDFSDESSDDSSDGDNGKKNSGSSKRKPVKLSLIKCKDSIVSTLNHHLLFYLKDKETNISIIEEVVALRYFEKKDKDDLLFGDYLSEESRIRKLFDLIKKLPAFKVEMCLIKLCNLADHPEVSKFIVRKLKDFHSFDVKFQ